MVPLRPKVSNQRISIVEKRQEDVCDSYLYNCKIDPGPFPLYETDSGVLRRYDNYDNLGSSDEPST